MATHNELGKKGEELAVEYLEKKGYKILEKNWYYKKAEVISLLSSAGFSDIKVYHRHEYSWTAIGTK